MTPAAARPSSAHPPTSDRLSNGAPGRDAGGGPDRHLATASTPASTTPPVARRSAGSPSVAGRDERLIVFDSFDDRGRPLTGVRRDGVRLRYQYGPDGDVLIRYSTGLCDWRTRWASGAGRSSRTAPGTPSSTIPDGRSPAPTDPAGGSSSVTDRMVRSPSTRTMSETPRRTTPAPKTVRPRSGETSETTGRTGSARPWVRRRCRRWDTMAWRAPTLNLDHALSADAQDEAREGTPGRSVESRVHWDGDRRVAVSARRLTIRAWRRTRGRSR